ncbi:Uncharacterised protein r2_g4362 [Pycnogonum litorale]
MFGHCQTTVQSCEGNKTLSVNLDDARRQISELYCASKQDADLRDKLDDATCELAAEKKKCSDIVKQLSNHAKENKTLSVNLDDARRQISELHCASKQDADLRDKLDDATCELAAEKKKCSDIVKQLSNHAKENKTLFLSRQLHRSDNHRDTS